jgi:hypothetical protein
LGKAFENGSLSSEPIRAHDAVCSLEIIMSIELTEEQAQALVASGEVPPILVDPKTQTDYVLIRKDLYERLTQEEYDDSPWTADERDALAWEAGKYAGWEEMSEYDDDVEQP